MMDLKREERKYHHLEHALCEGTGPKPAGWCDVELVHQALVKGNVTNVDTSINLLGKTINFPLIINAMTGGAPGLERINEALARVAKETGIALAVGSQTAAVYNPGVRHTYEVVRKVYPEGLILANVGALVKPEYAKEAVEMIEADALQIHLNVVQELVMKEGDRDFSSLYENVVKIKEAVDVPVILKEVGFGISRETAKELYQLGFTVLDLGGAGGTNFAAIELARHPQEHLDYLRFWGLPTAISLLEVNSLDLPFTVIASGGIHNALDIIKALALGAKAAGMAGVLLKIYDRCGEKALLDFLNSMQKEIQYLMLLTGAGKMEDIASIPVVITGYTQNWLTQRGIDTKKYDQRTTLGNDNFRGLNNKPKI
jgi:isopentenyl-diphosphate delta-isomerase